jgi:NAD-dependent DNA ligase
VSEHDNTFIDRGRLVDRGLDEFIGICKGLVFDGVVNYDEAKNLLVWLQNNRYIADKWPAVEIYEKLRIMLKKGFLSSEDEGELLSHLVALTGNPDVMFSGRNPSGNLPLCNPPPDVYFDGAVFVITGNLKIGSRAQVVDLITELGGEVVLKNVRMDTNFLVIGDIGSQAWIHSTHGRKIERAIELRDQLKTGIGIISEDHFTNAVNRLRGAIE